MFKKPLKVSSHNVLAGKDKKSLKKELLAHFHPESVERFLEKNEKILCDKLQGSKMLIYSTETYPALIDSTGKGTYFPSLYLLQEYPKFVESVFINPGVSSFIFKGANLMWPGVQNPEKLTHFKADDVRVIVDDVGKMIGIGAMTCSYEEMKAKKEGVAVFILHILEDKLWELGPKKNLDVAFSGEKEELKKTEEPQKTEETKKEESEKEEEEEEEDDEDQLELENFANLLNKGKKVAREAEEDSGPSKPSKKVAQETKKLEKEEPPKHVKGGKKDDLKGKKNIDSDDENDKKKGKKKGGKGGKGKENEEEKKKDNKKKEQPKKQKKNQESDEGEHSEEEENSEEEPKEKKAKKEENESDEEDADQSSVPTIPPKIMDEYINESFMNALKMSVTEKDLPMDASAFYANHMLLCKRENILIDLKNSSYKKIGKFFQSMAKIGLIEYKEAKKNSAPQVTRINRGHEKFETWEVTIGKVGTKKNDEEKKENEEKWPKVQIDELYKPKDSAKAIFQEKKADGLYSLEEARNALNDYIKKNEIKTEKKFFVMNPYLLNLLPPKTHYEEAAPEPEATHPVEEEPKLEGGEEICVPKKPKKKVAIDDRAEFILKEDLFARFFDEQLLKWHKITNLETKKSEIRAGNFKGISMTAEKAHNKNITKIVGLEQYGFDLEELSNKFQLKFACSVSTHELPGKNVNCKEFIVHGNFLQDIQDYFTNECKMDPRHISTVNKLNKDKKKK